jgi:hypothetical protein
MLVEYPDALPDSLNQQSSFEMTNNNPDDSRVLFSNDLVVFELDNTRGDDVRVDIVLADDQGNGLLPDGNAEVSWNQAGKRYVRFSRFPLRADQTTPMDSCEYEITLTNNTDANTGTAIQVAIYI